jgi:cytochrome c oxidase cbb3-type subunit III
MKNKFNHKLIACLLIADGLTIPGVAQNASQASIDHPLVDNNYNGVAWAFGAVLLLAVALLSYLLGRMNLSAETEKQPFSFKSWWAKMDAKLFTKAIPLEKEADHLLDHDYDGIQELDNSLPPWWKYGFYITIVFSVIYILHYHVWKTGPDPEQEYQTEMAVAAKQLEEYRKKAGDMVDEKTVTLADAKGIEEGGKLYQSTCMACHGSKGEGGVGPNLTDKFWLHGGSINDVFKTIKYGVPEKGMQAWEKTYSPSQIKNIASYIKSIAGSNPPNGKAPQGEPFEEKTTIAAKEATTVVKNESK